MTTLTVDGEMWCYQKPDFEALLVAELQRQQQCSQFCDTLLRTEGVSVPAHSCILSAISPHISSTLSSMPPPPAGQRHLLEFRALGACTLLHMVRLLYSGEMAGVGEKEKQEAVSAAAKLGIHGLVEVMKRDCNDRNEEGRHAEVGVQTEPQMPEENEGRGGRWRREVRDGSVFLWKEKMLDGEKDAWTQTDELQVNAAPPSEPAASSENISVAPLQSSGETDSHPFPTQITHIPVSLIYTPDENQTHPPSPAPVVSLQQCTSAGHTSVSVLAPPYTPVPQSALSLSNQEPLCADDPHCWWADPHGATRDVTTAEDWEDEQLEQFQGNIPGYISHFLNPHKEEGSSRGRPRRRQRAGAGGARRAGRGERRARRPRARTAGRGRGGLMQTVDVQEVGVSKLPKPLQQRWGLRMPRTGQGGGAVGRRLCLQTRELLKTTKGCQRRRGRNQVWDLSLCGDMKEEGVNRQRGRRRTTQLFDQDALPAGRAQRARGFCPPPQQIYNIHPISASSLSLQPPPSPALQSAALSYVSPASSLLHTTALPPLAPPPHEEQPEQFDRLLEEVMMGLDIIPKNNNSAAPHSQLPLTNGSSSCAFASSSHNLVQSNRQQACSGCLLKAAAGFQGSTQIISRGGSSCGNEAPVLQQQGEGELNEILDRFLQSFEQNIDSCAGRDEAEAGGQSCADVSQPCAGLRNGNAGSPTAPLPNTHATRPVECTQLAERQQNHEAESQLRHSHASARGAAFTKQPAGTLENNAAADKQPVRRRKNQYLFSLEKKNKRARKQASSTEIDHDGGDKLLRQIPVVKLERSGPLSLRVTPRERSRQALKAKSSAQRNAASSSGKHSHDSVFEKKQLFSWITKTYPIRSRFRDAQITNSEPFLEQLPPQGRAQRKRGRPKKIHLDRSPVQPRPVEPCRVDEQQERHEEETTLQTQEETQECSRRGKKRRAETQQETSDDVSVAKRASEPPVTSSASADCVSRAPAVETEDIIDVETVSLTDVEDLQGEEQDEKLTWREIKRGETEISLMEEVAESSCDEIIDVDGDEDGDDSQTEADKKDMKQSRNSSTLTCLVEVKPPVSPPSHSGTQNGLGSTGSWDEDNDEDIDVIGGSSPAPHPVIISWTSDVEENEDVDVVIEVNRDA